MGIGHPCQQVVRPHEPALEVAERTLGAAAHLEAAKAGRSTLDAALFWEHIEAAMFIARIESGLSERSCEGMPNQSWCGRQG